AHNVATAKRESMVTPFMEKRLEERASAAAFGRCGAARRGAVQGARPQQDERWCGSAPLNHNPVGFVKRGFRVFIAGVCEAFVSPAGPPAIADDEVRGGVPDERNGVA